MTIHPLALVSAEAQLGPNVQIGPFCVIESGATIGANCVLEARVSIKRGTLLGAGNLVCEGTVIGGFPQHAHMPEKPGRVRVGSHNVIRENVTIHRALEADHDTVVGDHNLIMVNAHVAHDCHIGSHVILTNNVMLAGHVTVEDRAYLSGASGVHQFCRIGALAMVGGQAHIKKDVPPFVTVDGLSSFVVGLNQVGLRRAGHKHDEVARLKAAYRVIYRSGLAWNEILEVLRGEFSDGLPSAFLPFLETTKRGIVCERRMPPGATIKLREETPADAHAEPELRVKYG